MPGDSPEREVASAEGIGPRLAHGAGSHTEANPATERVVAFVVACAACIAAAALMGRDLNWDYFNYHAYAALQWQGERIQQDFFAAGVQGYLNPLAYAPLGLMERAGWHSLAIACALAAVQSLNLLFLFLICRHLFAVLHAGHPTLLAALATLLGALSPPFWSQVGSTFIDATVAPMVMAAIWLVMRRGDGRALLLAGALAGGAVALKWTFAPYALGLWACTVARGCGAGERLRSLVFAGVGLVAGFGVLYGHWGWQLAKHHDSPLFPLFNGLFRSPDYPLHSDGFHRFIPHTLADLFSFPFRMATLDGWVYTEVSAPDVRPAVAVVLLGAAVLLLAGRLFRPRSRPHEGASAQQAQRVWLVLGVFFVVSAAAWVATSSNGRYAVPTLLLLGPLVWGLALSVLGERVGRSLGLLVLCVQMFHTASASEPRWNAQPWTAEMLPAQVPSSLVEQPHLMLTIGSSSESFVAAHVHPDSPFVNPIGMYSLPVGGPGWERFVRLREQWHGRTRVLFTAPDMRPTPLDHEIQGVIIDMIDPLGLTLDINACERLVFNAGTSPDPAQERRSRRHLFSCAALPKAAPDRQLAVERDLATRILDAFGARCGRYFQPSGAQITGSSGLWTRRYLRFDLFVHVDFRDDLVYFRQERQATPQVLGRVSTWEEDLENFKCGLPHGGLRGFPTLGGAR
jgi:hypothetical protein